MARTSNKDKIKREYLVNALKVLASGQLVTLASTAATRNRTAMSMYAYFSCTDDLHEHLVAYIIDKKVPRTTRIMDYLLSMPIGTPRGRRVMTEVLNMKQEPTS